jgi:hypothetical protein
VVLKASARRIDRVVWLAIYGGLLLLGVGLALKGELPTAGWSIAAVGVLAASVGAALIGVRSRIPDEPKQTGSKPAPPAPNAATRTPTSSRKP